MRTVLSAIAAGLLAFVIGAFSAPVAEARPPGELPLFLQLNGAPTRWVMPDGGQSGMFGSGTQCMPISSATTGGCQVIKFTPSAKVHTCTGTLDAGCVTTVTDPNYGDPVAADTPTYMVLPDNLGNTASNWLCQVPATGSANTPVFCMR